MAVAVYTDAGAGRERGSLEHVSRGFSRPRLINYDPIAVGQNDEAREEPSGSPDAGPPAEGGTGGAREEAVGSSWMGKARAAQQLWDYGDNVALAKLLDELEKAPIEEQQALEIARDLRGRLRPDPLAIGLWLVTLAIFCVVTYLFVLR